MTTCLLYFDDFSDLQVVVAVGQLADSGRLIPIAPEDRPYRSESHQVYLPAATLAQMPPEEVDVLLIPGGDVTPLLADPVLLRLVKRVCARERIVAAIDGGVVLLGRSGVLSGRRFTCCARDREPDRDTLEQYFANAVYTGAEVEVDGPVITAQGQAFVEFGIEVADRARCYPTPTERERVGNWLKNRPLGTSA
jgi:putative intracellular protease/amidase